MKRITNILLVACGTLCVVLGGVGVFVPLLPTTPFLLLAAACYARGSTKVYHRLLRSRWFGEYIRNYRMGRGIPLRETLLTLVALWVVIGSTAIGFVEAWWGRVILFCVAVGVTIHVVRIRRRIPIAAASGTSERPRLDGGDGPSQ